MSNHEGQYEEHRFTPVTNAMDLCDYVFLITDNQNKFPEYKLTKREQDNKEIVIVESREDSLINRIRNQVFEIYMCVFTANDINLNRQPERKNERLSKQLKAIDLCSRHLASIQLCRKRFKLSYRRIKYWGGKTRDLRGIIERWHESDKDRYKNI